MTIPHGKPSIPVDKAAADFATGHMSMKVDEMDTNHDGMISHDEYIAYSRRAFDKVKNPQGMLTTVDVTKYFATGNMKP